MATTIQQQESPLLRLPAELRLQIFEYVLAGQNFSSVIDNNTERLTHVIEDKTTDPATWHPLSSDPNHYFALSKTCRQTRADTRDLPLKLGTFCQLSKVIWTEDEKHQAWLIRERTEQIERVQREHVPERRIPVPFVAPTPVDMFPWRTCLDEEQQAAIRSIRFNLKTPWRFHLTYFNTLMRNRAAALIPMHPLSKFTGVRTVFVNYVHQWDPCPTQPNMQDTVDGIVRYLGRSDVEIVFEFTFKGYRGANVHMTPEERLRCMYLRFYEVWWKDGVFTEKSWSTGFGPEVGERRSRGNLWPEDNGGVIFNIPTLEELRGWRRGLRVKM
ncbi:hypothetical protein CC80DRAFT_591442 [Byssothecium circinans]|uniref:Uncharacterized protein n=1 Tax=Byssothecium circinans TaxID=147558 RepID=A0A6A5U988_9PLEO|nr:hypothetical protein CC80DRAFT_591442 [Byssothecium circinans]